MDTEDFVRLVYTSVLRRSPEDVGLESGVAALQQGMSPAAYLQSVASSDEFAGSRLVPGLSSARPAYDPAADELFNQARTADVSEATTSLSAFDAIGYEHFNSVIDAAYATFEAEMPGFSGQDFYVEQHRLRFFELSNIVAKLMAEGTSEDKTILDVGWSVNTLAVQRLFPGAQVWALDRPQMPMPASLQAHAIHQDLTAKDLDDVDFGLRADIILFAEVLEHLLVNPVKVISFLVRHLRPGGRLIITTPNFFRAGAVDAMARNDNPQPIFPYESGPEDAPHFHVREYCMRELIGYAKAAAGRLEAFFFSSCWDDAAIRDSRPQHEWSNMVVVVQRV